MNKQHGFLLTYRDVDLLRRALNAQKRRCHDLVEREKGFSVDGITVNFSSQWAADEIQALLAKVRWPEDGDADDAPDSESEQDQ